MKELRSFLTNTSPPTSLTKPLFKAHMESLGVWQNLAGDKNSTKEIVFYAIKDKKIEVIFHQH